MLPLYHFKLDDIKWFGTFNTKVLLVVSNANNIRPSEIEWGRKTGSVMHGGKGLRENGYLDIGKFYNLW